MSYAALKERWRSLYGTEPPAYKRQHMIRRLAYRIQELAYGGLSDEAKAELKRIAAEDEASRTATRKDRRRPKTTQPIPGTRLVRHWNGQRHMVTVVAGGSSTTASGIGPSRPSPRPSPAPTGAGRSSSACGRPGR